jgi:hypothetical protein
MDAAPDQWPRRLVGGDEAVDVFDTLGLGKTVLGLA